MSDPNISDIAKKAVGWSIFISVVMIVAGILAIAMPLEAGLAVNIFVAWMLIFAAVAHFVFAWFTRRTGSVLLKAAAGDSVFVRGDLSAGSSGARAGHVDAGIWRFIC